MQQYKSIFRKPQASQPTQAKVETMFVPPETFGASSASEPSDEALDMQNASAWDVAVRYHEFKSKLTSQALVKKLREISVAAVLERAQEVLGSVVHPVEVRSAPLSDLPAQADQPDFDLDETLENSPLAIASVTEAFHSDYPITDQDIWMTYNVHRRQPIILSVDTSLSMTGDKLALTAVALAVVLLQFPDDLIGIVAFENEAKILKNPEENISIAQLVERFLDVPAQGYTHLEDGLKMSLKLIQRVKAAGSGRPSSTVLLTDGKYTAGRDPAYLAPRFPHLVVIKMGTERASLGLCKDLAKKGRGVLREMGELETLPIIMYGVVKDILRGRSVL
ncbi:MAG: vWA domain-containing protein [Bdellovibrionia bacterium]